jgi:acylphosphatase
MAETAHLSAKVCGCVQGVFFRSFVQHAARNLGLKGYVRNLPGGDAVEVKAEGTKQQLERLVEQLKIGPPGAQVTSIEINWSDYPEQFRDFDIRY